MKASAAMLCLAILSIEAHRRGLSAAKLHLIYRDKAKDESRQSKSETSRNEEDNRRPLYRDLGDLVDSSYKSDGDFVRHVLEDNNVYDKKERLEVTTSISHVQLDDDSGAVNRYLECKHRRSWYKFTDNDIEKLLSIMDRIHKFYADNYAMHSLDGTFGLRTAEAEVQNVLERLPQSDRYFPFLKDLFEKMHATGETIVANLKKAGHVYSQTFMEIIERPLRYRGSYLKFEKGFVMERNPALVKKIFNESESDDCLAQMLGSGKYFGKECQMDEKCMSLETTPGTDSYVLTHQPLIFIAGEHRGCHERIILMLGGKEGADKIFKNWANTIYSQWLESLVDGDIPTDFVIEDVWYEQGFVAMLLGLVEASRADMLRKSFLRVQREGCIHDEDILGDTEKRGTVRIGACDSHKTAVYLGFLVMHLRFIFTPPACNMLL